MPSDYNSSTLANDIALVKLPCTKRFTFTESVKQISLPREHICEDWVSSKMITSGFGLLIGENSTLLVSSCLKFVTLNIMSNVDCLRYFGPFITPNHICAVGRDQDQHQGACRGDSGGPLITYVGQQPILIGLVSFGNKTCLHGPTVFTRVAPYLGWIDSIIYGW